MGTPEDIQPDKMLKALLAPSMGAAGGTRLPADFLVRLDPYGWWLAREVAGAGVADDRFADALTVQLDALAAGDTPRETARRLCRRMLTTLRTAQRQATPTPYGHIGFLRVDAWPTEVREPDQPSETARYTAACSLIVRPPA